MSDEDSAEDSPWPPADEQMRNARQHYWDIQNAVEKRRIQRRIESEEKRAEYRRQGEYDEIEPVFENSLRAYADSQFFEKLAKEYYTAGTSRFLPRRRRESSWSSSELASRTTRRRESVSAAHRLDEIDHEGGFDSTNIADHSGLRLPAGDNHFHRAWDRILAADIHLAGHIRARRKTSRKHSFLRALTRYAFIAGWIALFIWFMLRLEDAGQQFATLIPLLGVPSLIEVRAQHKNRFIERVGSIQSEYRNARRNLRRHITEGLEYGLEPCDFERDPSECLLTDWLREFR